jgi:hypothetical protein
MATKAINNIVRSVRPGSVFESALNLISSAVSFNQGDLLYLDTTNHLIKPVTSDTDAARILGVARNTIVNGKLISSYTGTSVDAAQAIEGIAGPQYGVICLLKLKSGDSFVAGGDVYASTTDAQTVSSTGTNKIGIFQDAAITAGSSSTGRVLLGCNNGAGFEL